MINWKLAMYNVLPWIKEEMENNGDRRVMISGKYNKHCGRSMIVSLSILMDKMNIPFVDRKDVKIDSLKYSFRRHMIGKGYIVRLYGRDSLIILEDPIIEIKHMQKQDSKNSDSEYVAESDEGYVSQDSYNKRMEKEDNIRKMRHGKDKKTLSDYKEKIDNMLLVLIREGIDKSENGLYVMNMYDVRKLLGLGFEIYSDYAIFNNVRNAMEDFNIIVGLKGYNGKRWTCQYITLRFKDDELFIWEREGFVSREEYEDCLKEEKKCRRIKRTVNECRNKDPNSLFNNKELVKKIFTECDVG